MLHIVASGLQDFERLNSPTGKPSIEFYKSVMRRRTRWASQWRRVEFDNKPDFGLTAVCTLPIQGELITRATLVIDLPDIYTPQIAAWNEYYDPSANIGVVGPSWAWTNGIGHAICSEVQFLIGDQIVDRLDSRLLEVLDEQTRPVEHFNSTDTLIARDPSTYSDQQTIQLFNPPQPPIAVPQTNLQTLEIVFPFWWNRGPGPQALPIQALWKDKVQLKVSFRTMQQCVYTSSRVIPGNPPLSANQGTGPLPNIAGCGFFVSDPTGPDIITDATSTSNFENLGFVVPNPFNGFVETKTTMPDTFHFKDAYWIVEYVSLEDREAAAYRMADLEIPFEQHIPMPVVTTGGAENVRIRMDQGGLVRELSWVAQRVEAPTYNAYFLFSKDLGPQGSNQSPNPCDIPWWPNAKIPNWDFGDGYIRPAFVDRRSDPIVDATMRIRGLPRFEHDSPSFFRSLIPALNCKRTPLIDRYIYRYDFGFWSTGGLAEALYLPVDEIRGYSNWDKLPKRELALTMNQEPCAQSQWIETGQETQIFLPKNGLQLVDESGIEGFEVQLVGAHPQPDTRGNNGNGAVIKGIIDLNQLRRINGYQGIYARVNANGSASLVLKTTAGYQWIAVAGGGGYGLTQYGSGGYAGNAVEIGWQGGNNAQSHAPVIGGAFDTYSNSGPSDTQNSSLRTYSNTFTILQNGSFTSLNLAFSLEQSPDLYTPTVQVEITITPSGPTPVIRIYTMEVPISLVNVQYQSYTITRITYPLATPTFDVYTGDIVTITFTGLGIGNPIVRVEPDMLTYYLSCTLKIKTDSTLTIVKYGGGGGGRLVDAGVGLGGLSPSVKDGTQMTTGSAFVESNVQTGGIGTIYAGGDGYYGGGAGILCGGGGGSYVSDMITQVNTYEDPTLGADANILLIPIQQVSVSPPSFDIYSWVTRYNRLRINSGRGAIMFNETA